MLCANMSHAGTTSLCPAERIPAELKRKNRRPKKSRNKIRKLESVLKGLKKVAAVGECSKESRVREDALRSERLSSECKKSLHQKAGGEQGGVVSSRRNQVFLRPTNVPLLNAPKNSTQFIIDDHENSNLFWNFHDSENEEPESHPTHQLDFRGDLSDDQLSPDDDSFWVEYSERDFQTVYETAHQEKLAEWSRKRLVGEISILERRQRKLRNSLSLVDPKIYLQKLQSELLSLQEDNRQLRLDLVRRSKKEEGHSGEEVPDSTSPTDPGSSNTSSSEDEAL